MLKAHYGIKAVSQRTGLSAHVIRIWEKRYGAVKPERTDTNRRLYTEEQMERLVLLRDLTNAGYTIRTVARLPTDRLRKMAADALPAPPRAESVAGTKEEASLLDDCIAAVKALDSIALQKTLNRSSTLLGAQGLLQKVIAPLAHKIGELWRQGLITAAHEHFASAVIRIFLGHAAKPFAGAENAPVIVVATPAGQLHELGALMVGAAAAHVGWHVIYLGASLPAAEIAGAARQNQAAAVALSLVYPEDDPRLEGELARLRDLLPNTLLLAGGRAMRAYLEALEQHGFVQIEDLTQLGSVLDEWRRPSKKAKR